MRIFAVLVFILSSSGTSWQARGNETDPRLRELNRQLLDWGLGGIHRVSYTSSEIKADTVEAVEPSTDDFLPFKISKALGAQPWANLRIEPFGIKTIDKDTYYEMELQFQGPDSISKVQNDFGNHKELAHELKGLVPEPSPMLFVRLGFNFVPDWARHQNNMLEVGEAPQTKAQMLSFLRADLALARLREEFKNHKIKLKTNALVTTLRGDGGENTFLSILLSVGFTLNLPPEIPPLRAHIFFYKYLFGGLLEPRPINLAQASQSGRPGLLSSIVQRITRSPDKCDLLFNSGLPQLIGPTGVPNSSFRFNPKATIVAFKTPLGSIDFLVQRAR